MLNTPAKMRYWSTSQASNRAVEASILGGHPEIKLKAFEEQGTFPNHFDSD
jgi:hypothetical protein